VVPAFPHHFFIKLQTHTDRSNYVSVRTATRYELNTCGTGDLFMSGTSHHFPVRR